MKADSGFDGQSGMKFKLTGNCQIYDNPMGEWGYSKKETLLLASIPISITIYLVYIGAGPLYLFIFLFCLSIMLVVNYTIYESRPYMVYVYDEGVALFFNFRRNIFLRWGEIVWICIGNTDKTMRPAVISVKGFPRYRLSREIAWDLTRRYTVAMGKPPAGTRPDE